MDLASVLRVRAQLFAKGVGPQLLACDEEEMFSPDFEGDDPAYDTAARLLSFPARAHSLAALSEPSAYDAPLVLGNTSDIYNGLVVGSRADMEERDAPSSGEQRQQEPSSGPSNAAAPSRP